jgi:hypothetical protein
VWEALTAVQLTLANKPRIELPEAQAQNFVVALPRQVRLWAAALISQTQEASGPAAGGHHRIRC